MKPMLFFPQRLNRWMLQTLQPASLGAAALALGLLLPAGVTAATSTWSGGSTDGNWGAAANWDVAFANGADVIFTGSAHTSTFLGSNVRTVNSITFPNTATAAFKIQLSASDNNGGATKTLTFQAGNSGITINSGDTVSHQITGSTGGTGSYIALAGNLTITHNGTMPFTISRPISGAYSLTKTGPGTVIYSGPGTYVTLYSGNTTISAGTWKLGAASVMPNGAGFGNVLVNGTLDLGGFSQTINGLSGSGLVDNTAAGAATLTVGANDQTSTFSGVITNTGGALSLTKTGVGTLTLAGTNTYGGATTINAGQLVGVTGGSASNSAVKLNAGAATGTIQITDNTLQWSCASLTTAAAGTLQFNFGVLAPSATVAPLQVLGAAAFTATPTVSVVGANLSVGTFPLMTWGSTSGTAPTAVTLPAGVTGSLSVSGNTLDLVISSVNISISKANDADNLNLTTSWVGGVVPGTGATAQWDSTVTAANTTVLGADQTWMGIKIVNPAGLVTINAGNTLTLAAAGTDIDMSSATANLTLNCALALSAASVWDVASGQTLTLGGVVSGSVPITKQGLGSATLTAANTFNAGLTLTAGTLSLNNAAALGDPAGTFTITGGAIDNTSGAALVLTNGNPVAWNGNFAFTGSQNLNLGPSAVTMNAGRTVTVNAGNLTVSGPIGGAFKLTKGGVGTLTLAGANTFSGGVTLNAGTLDINNAAALGTTAGTFTVAGGTIDNTSAGALVLTNNNPQAWNADVTFTGTHNLDLGAGAVTLSATRTVTVNANTLTVDGAIGGAFGLTKVGNGTLLLNGASGFTGTVTITGPLKASLLTNAGAASSLGAGTLVELGSASTSGSLEYTGTGAATTDHQIQIGSSGNGSGDATLLNNSAAATNTVTFANAAFNVAATGANSTGARTLTLGGSNPGTNSILGVIANNNTGAGINSAINLTKSGTGTWVLSGANTYTGNTTVSGGTLLVNNSLASPAVAVNSGTLGGIGTLAGTVTVASGGTLQPGLGGTDTESLTMTNSLTLSGKVWLVINRTNAQTASQIAGLNTLNLGGTLTVTNVGPAVQAGDTFTLFAATNTAGSFSATNLPNISPLVWHWNPAAGTLIAGGGTASNPTNLTFTVSSGTGTLTWPLDHQGWMVQSNTLNIAVTNDWVDISNTAAGTNYSFTIDPTQTNVFYRLRKP